jgi:hypothetical protein
MWFVIAAAHATLYSLSAGHKGILSPPIRARAFRIGEIQKVESPVLFKWSEPCYLLERTDQRTQKHAVQTGRRRPGSRLDPERRSRPAGVSLSYVSLFSFSLSRSSLLSFLNVRMSVNSLKLETEVGNWSWKFEIEFWIGIWNKEKTEWLLAWPAQDAGFPSGLIWGGSLACPVP